MTEVDPLVRPLISHVKPPEQSAATPELRGNAPHSWSPDGTKVLVPFAPGGGFENLYLVDVSQVGFEPLDFLTSASLLYANPSSSHLIDPQWNPSLAFPRISFSVGPTLYTCGSDGSGLKVLATSAWGPRWSPDGKYIAYTSSVQKGLQSPKLKIMRIPSSGGTAVNLTGDLDANKSKWAYRWTP